MLTASSVEEVDNAYGRGHRAKSGQTARARNDGAPSSATFTGRRHGAATRHGRMRARAMARSIPDDSPTVLMVLEAALSGESMSKPPRMSDPLGPRSTTTSVSRRAEWNEHCMSLSLKGMRQPPDGFAGCTHDERNQPAISRFLVRDRRRAGATIALHAGQSPHPLRRRPRRVPTRGCSGGRQERGDLHSGSARKFHEHETHPLQQGTRVNGAR